MPPLVSVLLPVYNGMEYLELAIRSILDQSYHDFELIIVNDGSTDSTSNILNYFEDLDPRIMVINQKNQGIVKSLNAALSVAKGAYCARMDADDISLANRLDLQVHYLENNPNVHVVGGQGYIIDHEGDFICPLMVLTDHKKIDDDLLYFFNSRGIIHPSVMFRTDVVRNLGGYREDYIWAEDLDLFLRVAEMGQVANLESTIIYYRKHGYSITDKNAAIQRMNALAAVNDARVRRGFKAMPDEISPTKNYVQSHLDYQYSLAITALSYGWTNTAKKYIKKIYSSYGLNMQLIKLFVKFILFSLKK